MHKLLVGLTLVALPLAALAQTAPTAATRPYFQQEVNYSIDVTLDDQQHVLTGREEMQYVNNSPDALPFIWVHLWPNAYRDNHTAFARQQRQLGKRKFEFASAQQRGYIDQLDFKVNGQPAKLEYDPKNPDMAKLVLPQPLAPGQRATISTPFRVKLPDSFSRLGHVDQSYQITQWYPKPAVYDRDGWHPMPYLDQGEFYSEFGSFDVRITLPENYTVGATGELQNPDEIARLDRLALASAAKAKAEDFGSEVSFPASASTTKTLRFTQNQVHDFAWFADKRFNVLKDTVQIPGTARPVTTWLMFTNRNAGEWLKRRDDIKKALVGYSKWVGPYPYSAATAVDGALSAGSGMEYPMVTVTEPAAIIHEVGHNWFYGILASNERDQPWQDEGVNSYLEARVQRQDDPNKTFMGSMQGFPVKALGLDGLPPDAIEHAAWQAPASRGLDQPAGNTASTQYPSYNYGAIVYQKSAALLRYLAGYLGQDKFDQGMRLYYDRWKFRHPAPADMQAAFEEASGQKLDWFFQSMLNTTTRYNATVSDLLLTNDQIKVLVRNESNAAFAVPVSTVDAQGKVLETLWTPAFGGPEAEAQASDQLDTDVTQLNFRRTAEVAAVVIDPQYLSPEINRRDNRRQLSGLLPGLEPIKLRPLASLERWDQAAIHWLPVLGVNTYDKLMLGAAFYNNPLVPKKLSYVLMPMFSFNRKDLKGVGQVKLTSIASGRVLERVTTSFLATRFERYTKYEPSLTLDFRRATPAYPRQQVQVAYTRINQMGSEEGVRGEANYKGSPDYFVPTLRYTVAGGNAVRKYGADIEFNTFVPDSLGVNSQAAQLLRMTGTYEHHYAPNRSFRVRLFGGRFLTQLPNSPFVIGLSGSPDYRRQTAFLDRRQISNTWTAQTHQSDDRDGAFKAFLPVFSRKWLATLNLETDLPKTPLIVFADLGVTNSQQLISPMRNQRLFYDAGLALSTLDGALRLYVPIVGSQYTNGLPDGRKDFTDRIRFVFDLQKMNPLRLLDQAFN
ncbi:M1 family metallopeptidase [Hymenobacter koreensis]|uniref:Peptidase M1 membrane alanine aminopeptidase domain-containing protein n=1 Tax=Hymenobacter koreensis TaxID=1084523 RepID=A0ABP8IVP5_9BACT